MRYAWHFSGSFTFVFGPAFLLFERSTASIRSPHKTLHRHQPNYQVQTGPCAEHVLPRNPKQSFCQYQRQLHGLLLYRLLEHRLDERGALFHLLKSQNLHRDLHLDGDFSNILKQNLLFVRSCQEPSWPSDLTILFSAFKNSNTTPLPNAAFNSLDSAVQTHSLCFEMQKVSFPMTSSTAVAAWFLSLPDTTVITMSRWDR